jgi:translation elongation factor EF-1beta
MTELEANVRAIEKDGLVWGGSKLVAVGFGIKKLQINLVIEDEKVSLDELQAQIEEDEDHVQSTDIVSCNHLIGQGTRNANYLLRLPCRNCKLPAWWRCFESGRIHAATSVRKAAGLGCDWDHIQVDMLDLMR